MTDKDINLYEQMNENIADIIALDGSPSSLYASAYIKDLRAETIRLREELKSAKQQAVQEFANKLLAEFEEQQNFYKVANIPNKDINLVTVDRCIKDTKIMLKEFTENGTK